MSRGPELREFSWVPEETYKFSGAFVNAIILSIIRVSFRSVARDDKLAGERDDNFRAVPAFVEVARHDSSM